MNKTNGFAISWFFAPYIGSADIDFYKRIKNTNIDYLVAQVAREIKDDRLLRCPGTRVSSAWRSGLITKSPHRVCAREVLQRSFENFEAADRKFDFIISHSNELISHEAAARIRQKYPGIPWIAYFGDLFARNPYIAHMPGYPLVKEDTFIEEETLRNADIILLNNEYQRDLMFSGDLAKYASKAVVIPHCFDPAMYGVGVQNESTKFVFSRGTLYHVKRTAQPILQAVDRLLDIYPEYKQKFEVRFYGASPYPNDLNAHTGMRNADHVHFESAVSYLDSLELMRQSDVLLLVDGMFNEEEDGIKCNPFFPGKLADYMGAMKPIAAVTMAVGPTADILLRSRNLIADLRVDRIAYILKRYLDGKVTPDFSVYADYSINTIAPQMENAIRSVVKE